MQIEVRETPDYIAPSDVFECDINNTGFATIDLDTIISEIEFGSTTELNITFHLSPLNAQLGTNAIPLNHTATSNPQLIYTRVENANTGCYSVETFNINTLALPEVNYGETLLACGNNYDFEQPWDLTQIELNLLDGRQFGIEYSYFLSEEDLQNNSNTIPNPSNFENTVNPQTIYAKVENTITGCFSSVPFQLIINSPPQINTIESFSYCANDENIIDLSEINLALLDNTFNILVSYHTNEADAEANISALDSSYIYTSNEETLYARVEYSTTGCYAVYPLQIQINQLPIANQPNNLIACDNDFDGFLDFDLSVQNDAILNGQNPDAYSVYFFNSAEDALEKTNVLAINYIASNNDIIYARLEHNITGCFDTTQFSVIINSLPIIDIDDQILCLNDLPLIVSAETNNPTDTFLWSTNSTASEIEITEIGTYSISITNEFGCENTITFNVTESQSATIDVIETIDFSDPNNITITVNGIGNYLYQLNDLPFQTSNVFINVPIGYNTITIIDQNGCARVTRNVLVIDTPKHITPNGDGDFDTWHITGVETLPGTVVYIFDRYGKLLKELGPNSSGWDGTYNGNQMPAGDYWYVANVIQNGISFQVKGHFALKR
jgi:gliding motility-associated-like protein